MAPRFPILLALFYSHAMSIASDGKKFAQTPRKSTGRRALYCCQHISFIVSNKILHHDSDAIAPSSWFTNEYVFEIVNLLWHKTLLLNRRPELGKSDVTD